MTTTTVTETQTPAQELRAASKALRCEHRFLIQPPHGSLARPSDCTECGVPHDHSDPVTGDARDLPKKLAELFDLLADEMEDSCATELETRLDDGRRRKFVFAGDVAAPEAIDETWTAALKVARSIHGKAA